MPTTVKQNGGLILETSNTNDSGLVVKNASSNASQFAVNGAGGFGIFGTSPLTGVPVSFAQTYDTTDATLSSYTADAEASAYAGIESGSTGAVFAQLTDLNALRVAYENLRAHSEDVGKAVNSIVDALQAFGLVG